MNAYVKTKNVGSCTRHSHTTRAMNHVGFCTTCVASGQDSSRSALKVLGGVSAVYYAYSLSLFPRVML